MRQVEEFSIGSVLKATFQVFAKNFIAFVLLALIIMVPSTLLIGWAEASFDLLGAAGISLLLNLFSGTLMQAVFICAVFHTLRGDQQSVFGSLAQAGHALPYSILASLVATIVISLGMLLLIVPGILFYLMFWLAVPVAAIERSWPKRALTRSAELTKGHRGKLFGMFLLYLAASVGVGVIAAFAFLGDLDQLLVPAATIADPLNWIAWLFAAILSVMVSVTYYDLRFLKDDMESESLGEVFD